MKRNNPLSPFWRVSPFAMFEGDGDGDGGGGGTPVALVSHDGAFAENWKDSLDEDIRGEPCLDLVGDFAGAMKQLVHAQKNVGKNKVVIPGDGASQADWDAFYTAGGKPGAAADYAYKAPEEGFKLDDNVVKETREFLFSIGASQWQAKQILARLHDGGAQGEKDKDAVLVRETEEAAQALKDKLGGAYEERVHIADRLLHETNKDDDERKAHMIKKYGRDPLFIEWASEVGKSLVEAEMLNAQLTQTAPKEAQRELDELESSPDWIDFQSGEMQRTNPAKHRRYLEKQTELYDIIAPEQG